MTDAEIKDKEGEYFDESHYHTGKVNEDVDVYSDSGLLLLKLKKKLPESIILYRSCKFVKKCSQRKTMKTEALPQDL